MTLCKFQSFLNTMSCTVYHKDFLRCWSDHDHNFCICNTSLLEGVGVGRRERDQHTIHMLKLTLSTLVLVLKGLKRLLQRHNVHVVGAQLVSWCFEPSQPQRITSGLNTNFTLSPSHSFHKSSCHKSCFFVCVF